MMKKYISNSVEDTNKIAEDFARTIEPGQIVLLVGDLGAGKTAFVKGVVKALHGDPDQVTSPTFTIVNEYSLDDFPIYHFDLYRLENPNELYNIGFEEYFYGSGVCFIEWPERASDSFDDSTIVVNIKKLGDNKREISF